MDIKDEWAALKSEWRDAYDAYKEKANQLDAEIRSLKNEIDENITAANTIRSDFQTDGLIDKLTAALQWFKPEFKDESVQDFTIEFRRAVPEFELEYTAYHLMDKPPKIGKRKKLEEKRTEFAGEQNSFHNDIQKRKDARNLFHSVRRITRIYYQLLNQMHATIRRLILPELHWVHTFLYADAIAHVIRVGDDPQTAYLQPKPIASYANSRYRIHYTFIQNTFMLQRLMADFYHKGYVSRLIQQDTLSEGEIEAFEKKASGIYDTLHKIDTTAVM